MDGKADPYRAFRQLERRMPGVNRDNPQPPVPAIAPSAQPAESSARERRLAEAAKELLACLKSEHSRCPGYRIVEDIGPNADAQDCAPCEVCELIARSVDVSAYGLEVRRDG